MVPSSRALLVLIACLAALTACGRRVEPSAPLVPGANAVVVRNVDGDTIRAKVGGRDAILGADGKEILGAKAVTEEVPNPTGGWQAEGGVLICGTGPRGQHG